MANGLLNVLYVGSLNQGGTCLQRLQALKSLGHKVTGLDTDPPLVHTQSRTLFQRIRYKFNGPKDLAGINRQILAEGESGEWDILWLDKGITVELATLKAFRRLQPESRIVGFARDYMVASHNHSRQFLEHLPEYDVFFTTKSYAVNEMLAMGARRVIFVNNSYDAGTHRPIQITPEDRARLGGPVGFVGYYEPDRAESLLRVAQAGFKVRVWGQDWHHCHIKHPNLHIEAKALWSDDYAKALCASDINIAFLRKINRDLQTGRSVEIPACGAFMLAERTHEHLALFAEDKEAAYFADDDELVQKVTYYLSHDQQRREVAAAGRRRAVESGYDNPARLQWMLSQVIRPADCRLVAGESER